MSSVLNTRTQAELIWLNRAGYIVLMVGRNCACRDQNILRSQYILLHRQSVRTLRDQVVDFRKTAI